MLLKSSLLATWLKQKGDNIHVQGSVYMCVLCDAVFGTLRCSPCVVERKRWTKRQSKRRRWNRKVLFKSCHRNHYSKKTNKQLYIDTGVSSLINPLPSGGMQTSGDVGREGVNGGRSGTLTE